MQNTPRNVSRRQEGGKNKVRKVLLAASSSAVVFLGVASLALPASASESTAGVTVQSGGMVRAGSHVAGLTTSGFNRRVTVGYKPHGSLSVPGGKIFHVQAKVVGPNGTFVNVPNACVT